MNPLLETLLSGLNSAFLSFLDSNKYTRKILAALGEPYLAGHSLAEGLEAIRHSYQRRQRYSTFDILGEEARSRIEAEMCIRNYRKAISNFYQMFSGEYDIAEHPHRRPVSVSVKPSSICLVTEQNPVLQLDEDTALPGQLEKIVKFAAEHNVDVTLDMEDHRWTTASLDAAQQLWQKGAAYSNLGIVLQSRLYRTEQDIQHYLLESSYPFPKEKLRVRLCIGIYNEPGQLATRNKSEMKDRLVQHAETLLQAGVYTEIATHDPVVLRYIFNKIIYGQGIQPDRYEFQFLRGVHHGEKMGKYFRELGCVVRDYMPVEVSPGEGMAYMLRRLKSNPSLVWNGVKNVVGRKVEKKMGKRG